MSDTYEITITAKGADGKEARQDFECQTVEEGGPQQAVTEIVQSVSPGVASRIKTVSNGHQMLDWIDARVAQDGRALLRLSVR